MGINNYNSTFNANVYQSERDQFINAGRNGVMNVTVVDARHAAADLRVAVAATRLPPGSVKDVGRQLDEIDAGLAARNRIGVESPGGWIGSPACSGPPARSSPGAPRW